jgi:hypothetical protein
MWQRLLAWLMRFSRTSGLGVAPGTVVNAELSSMAAYETDAALLTIVTNGNLGS